MGEWIVYVIRSKTTGRHYVGATSNLSRRLADHARGKSRSVRGRGPFELLLTEQFSSRAEAGSRERQIKRYKGGKAFKNLLARYERSAASAMSPSSSG